MKIWDPVYWLTELTTVLSHCGTTSNVSFHCFQSSFSMIVSILEGGQKANQIFLPVLESASKAKKLRATLSIFERSRFFFNLPSFIMESIDLVQYPSPTNFSLISDMHSDRVDSTLPFGITKRENIFWKTGLANCYLLVQRRMTRLPFLNNNDRNEF